MPRPPRLEFPGATYHVTTRGNERKAIFRDDIDRQDFLGMIAHYREKFRFRLLAYCLMTNHVHLAIRTAERRGAWQDRNQQIKTDPVKLRGARRDDVFHGTPECWASTSS